MRINARIDGLSGAMGAELARLERGVTAGMEKATQGLTEELNSVTAAALGPRLRRTWKANTYPSGQASMNPAGYVYSKIPDIIDFNSAATVVVPRFGEAMAIPTDAVPRSGRRASKKMTPFEVEVHFNAQLAPVRLRGGGIGLVIDVVAGLRRGFRRATPIRLKGRKGMAPRPKQTVLMFVLKRQVVGRRRIDVEGIAARWGARVPGLIEAELSAGQGG